MKHLNQFFALVATAIISINSLNAAVRTWTGGSSTNWHSGSNWSGGSVPGSSDTAIIPTSVSSNRNPAISSNNVTLRRFVINGLTITVSNGRTITVNGEMQINGGSLTAGGTVTATNFTINNGTFILSGNDFNVSSNLIVNNGLLNAGSSNITANYVDINNGEFRLRDNNLNPGTLVTLDGGLLTNTSGNQLDFSSDFSFLSGTINMNSQNMNISGTYYFVDGSLTNAGNQITASNVEIDFTGTHTMGIDVRVTSSMTFTSGILESSSNFLLIFDNNATVTGASNTSHVNGPVRKEVSSASTTFIFPIGNGTFYTPLEMSGYSSINNADYFTAQYFSGSHSQANGTMGTGLDHVSKTEYWVLDRASSGNASTAVNVRLAYDAANRSGSVTDIGKLTVARWDGSQWVNHGRGNSSTGNTSTGTVITSAVVSSFSPFTFGSISTANPLPIALLNFNAKAITNAIDVKWTTTSEINNDFFTIEKSFNGSEWLSIATVKGAGNSEVLTNYQHTDLNPVNGVQYYRLKQTDINGDFTYSAIVAVVFGQSKLNNTLTMYPVPANNVLNIESSMDLSAGAVVNVFNAQGSLVMTANSNDNQLQLDIQNLESGIYFIEINAGAEIVKSKFQKL